MPIYTQSNYSNNLSCLGFADGTNLASGPY